MMVSPSAIAREILYRVQGDEMGEVWEMGDDRS